MKTILTGLYKLFTEKNATMVEINPLGVTKDGEIKICDSKVKIDDNA